MTRQVTSVPIARWCDVAPVFADLAGEPLDLDATLDCGQAFRWSPASDDSSAWIGVVGGTIWRVDVADGVLSARAVPARRDDAVRRFLFDYFALDRPLSPRLDRIARAHPHAADAVAQYAGLRILNQAAVEALLSFAIASATNVPRIRRSIALMAARFGEPIAIVDGAPYFRFPTAAALASADSRELYVDCNLAYRVDTLQAIARVLETRGEHWLTELRGQRYDAAHAALDALSGIGPKIADCVCLFGLGFQPAVPVDAHVWQIARRLFGDAITTRTLTSVAYRRIGDLFRALFGEDAGLAQQYLFTARRGQSARRTRAGETVVPSHLSHREETCA